MKEIAKDQRQIGAQQPNPDVQPAIRMSACNQNHDQPNVAVMHADAHGETTNREAVPRVDSCR